MFMITVSPDKGANIGMEILCLESTDQCIIIVTLVQCQAHAQYNKYVGLWTSFISENAVACIGEKVGERKFCMMETQI